MLAARFKKTVWKHWLEVLLILILGLVTVVLVMVLFGSAPGGTQSFPAITIFPRLCPI